jgi:hypothetical protein
MGVRVGFAVLVKVAAFGIDVIVGFGVTVAVDTGVSLGSMVKVGDTGLEVIVCDGTAIQDVQPAVKINIKIRIVNPGSCLIFTLKVTVTPHMYFTP